VALRQCAEWDTWYPSTHLDLIWYSSDGFEADLLALAGTTIQQVLPRAPGILPAREPAAR